MKAVWMKMVAVSLLVGGIVGCSAEPPASSQPRPAADEDEKDENGSGTKPAGEAPAGSSRR